MKDTNFSRAFTLAELLTAVLVISVIMVALAPVITKRMQENISVETDRKKGEEIWTNPGTYTFQAPVGINILEISGAGGGGGGAGAVMKNYSKTYSGSSTRTITVPKGVSRVTFTLEGAGGGGGGANAKTKNDTCKYPLTIPSMADNGKDLCVGLPELSAGYTGYIDVVNVGTAGTRNVTCWVATASQNTAGYCSATSWPSASPYFKGGGCKKMVCTREATNHICAFLTNEYVGEDSRVIQYRMLTKAELERMSGESVSSNQYKWIFSKGLDLGMHMYKDGAATGGRFTAANENGSCRSPISTACCPYRIHIQEGYGYIIDTDYWGSNPNELVFENRGILYDGGNNNQTAQVRCVRELNNWDQYSGAGGATGAKLTKTINVQPGDTLTFVIGAGGAGGNKGGGTGSQGGSTCVEHKRNGVRYTDPDNSLNNGYYCAYGGYGGKGATTSANGQPNSTLAACTHTDGCTKSTNGSAGGSAQGGKGANGPDGATADTGQNNTAGLGFNATDYTTGGSGGFCQRGNRTPSNCQKGGKGADGRFTIEFDQYVAGGGGGAAGAAGTGKSGNYHPIKMRVQGGETITFTIGAGGLGGQFSTDGEDGQDTIIAKKNNPEVFAFRGGLGGKVGLFNGTCAYDTLGCGVGGLGGAGGKYPNYLNTPNSFSYLNAPTKAVGKQGSQDTKGFQGGSGGATVIGEYGSCGGFEVNTDNGCSKYDANGNGGQKHNPITNLLGGEGGGGAGTDGKDGGSGGSGAPGYIRIKWDEANNE